jgi:hypothetical protein
VGVEEVEVPAVEGVASEHRHGKIANLQTLHNNYEGQSCFITRTIIYIILSR